MYEDNDFMYEDETIQYDTSQHEQYPLKKGRVTEYKYIEMLHAELVGFSDDEKWGTVGNTIDFLETVLM